MMRLEKINSNAKTEQSLTSIMLVWLSLIPESLPVEIKKEEKNIVMIVLWIKYISFSQNKVLEIN